MPIQQFHSPDFSLRQLQYAVAVAETGGFGAAASLCGVSQPSLSAQVSKLEAVLGHELFVRGGRGVTLAPAGERLIPVFRAALNAAAGVEVAATTLHDPYAVPVRVAVIPTVAPYLLPAVARVLGRDTGPSVHWLELQTAVAERAIANGKADAILIADPPFDASLHVEELGWEPFVAALPRGDTDSACVSLSWLHAQQVLLLEDGHCLRDQTLSLCMVPRAQQSPYRATSLGTLLQMVSAGFGVSVLPAMAVEMEQGRADIVVCRFESGEIGRTLRMAWHVGHPQERVLAELADSLRAAMRTAVACGLDAAGPAGT